MPDDMVLAEIRIIRNKYIQDQVNRQIGRREGDATAAQITAWETEAGVRWDDSFPALAMLVVAS